MAGFDQTTHGKLDKAGWARTSRRLRGEVGVVRECDCDRQRVTALASEACCQTGVGVFL